MFLLTYKHYYEKHSNIEFDRKIFTVVAYEMKFWKTTEHEFLCYSKESISLLTFPWNNIKVIEWMSRYVHTK